MINGLRAALLPVLSCLICVLQLAAQESPPVAPAGTLIAAGRLTGNTYSNSVIGFSYPLGDDWQVDPAMARQLRGGSEILLVADRENQTEYPDRLIIIADAVSAYGGAPVKDYVLKIASNWLKQGGEIAHQGIEADVGPQHFYRLDYVDPSGPTLVFKTFIATERLGYFLSWTFVVQRQEELTPLVSSLQRTTFQTVDATPLTGILKPEPPRPTVALPTKVRVSASVTERLVTKKVQPIYPDDARRNHIEGTVVMKVVISEAGDVEDLSLISGDPALAPAAMQAVKQWKYKPFLLNNRPVKVETQVTINFILSSTRPATT